MRTLIITLLTLTSTILCAQKTITWVGGTPGNETNWHEPKNWSNHHVPNEFSDVIIPDVSTSTFATPVIRAGYIELNSIQLAAASKLTIKKRAKLIVHGRAEGLCKSDLEIEGAFYAFNEAANKQVDVKISFFKN